MRVYSEPTVAPRIQKGTSKGAIANRLEAEKYPLIYIDEGDVSIEDSVIMAGQKAMSLLGASIAGVIGFLRDNGVLAYATREGSLMYPASLLLDFSSIGTEHKDLVSSPFRIGDVSCRCLPELAGDASTSLEYTVISVVIDGEPSTNYYVEDGLLYTDGLTSNSKVIIRTKLIKYFLFAASVNVIDGYSHFTLLEDNQVEITEHDAAIYRKTNSRHRGIC